MCSAALPILPSVLNSTSGQEEHLPLIGIESARFVITSVGFFIAQVSHRISLCAIPVEIQTAPLPGPGQCASSRVRWNRIKYPEPPFGYAFTSASAEVRERTGLVSLIYVQEDPDCKPGGNCGARDSRLP